MIQVQTFLNVADNSGARKIMCIRVLGGNKKYAKVGDTIIGVVKDASPNMAVKRSDVVRAVVDAAAPRAQQAPRNEVAKAEDAAP